jgi:uncharacterized repeat protein (TIGR02543 family)
MSLSSGNRFRCYPTENQKLAISQWMECQRVIYNAKVATFVQSLWRASVIVLMSAAILVSCGRGTSTNSASTYTITYNGNGNTGGSVPIDSTIYSEGQTVTVLGNTGNLVETGYSFVGWNTQANGSGTTYAQGQTFPMGEANITLYAIWAEIYTITYNGNSNTGGSVPVDSASYVQGQTVMVLGNTGGLTKTGYSFIGWNMQADGSGTIYTQPQSFMIGAANVTLYAMWTTNPTYTVTYNGNGNTGGGVPIDTDNYVQSQMVTVFGNTGNLVNTDYSFSGWNTLSNGSGTTYMQAQTFAMGTANVTLYAKWTPSVNLWTWVHGANTVNQIGTYGTKGVAAAADLPGARSYAVSWIDSNNNRWLFGGQGYDSIGTNVGALSDLWKFDGINWTWVSGANTSSQIGSYGTEGVAATANIPGAHFGAVSWIDSNDNLWLFGGQGYDSNSNVGYLNDLWKFDGTNWIWVSGANTVGQIGTYGAKGVAAAASVPGARWLAVSWRDSSGNLWLFGGQGYDANGNVGYLSDLWKFDGANWTWVSGANTVGQIGTYGTKGVAAAINGPGGRNGAVSWIDNSGNLWLFGGQGYGSFSNNVGYLNDLWKFDGTNWTWVSGANTTNQIGTYGTKGIAAATNVPDARSAAISWIDSSGNLWLFGGNPDFNDLWKFDGTNWTWVSGATAAGQIGTYGTKGVAATANVPGARNGAISWIESSGNVWLFGGSGYDSTGTTGYLNDLWLYQP